MSKFSLILIVSSILALFGGGIWRRAHMAIAPPIHDPISYDCKAEFVWRALAKGDLHGVLNGPMAPRPPGAALVLYPFGFRASIRSFLFRSVFAPLLIWAIALCIPILRLLKGRGDALLGSALVGGLMTLPLFYHFELNDAFLKAYNVVNQWGMVDALEGAIAALAISLLCFGIANRTKIWCAVAWLVCAFTLFIKPSGLLLMMTLVGIAAVEFVILILENPSHRSAILKLAGFVYAIGFCIFAVVLWLAFSSDYLSREVIARAVKASQFLLIRNEGQELFAMLALFVVPVVGWWWLCPGLFYTGLVIAETAQSLAKRQRYVLGVRLAAAGAILVAAVSWWILLAGQDPRYLFPFILMIIAWFIPEVFQRIRQYGPPARGAVIAYCLAPTFLLAGLLWSKQPPMIFQQLMGINLSAGGYAAEVNQGRWLLAESGRLGRPLNLYSLGNLGAGVVEMMDWVQSIEHQNAPHKLLVSRPLNWVDSPGLRANELVLTDFILLEDVQPLGSPGTQLISSWPQEVECFKQFAYSTRGADKNGLELVSDGPVKLLRVADRLKFSEALYTWANSIHWTNDFRDRNKAFMQKSPG
jgi:hypothetical protein